MKRMQTSTVKIALHNQGECTQDLLNIPHLLLLNRLIERVGRATRIAVFRKLREKTQKKQESAPSINLLTCPRER